MISPKFLLSAEARELALLDYINGRLPAVLLRRGAPVEQFLDRVNYAHIRAIPADIDIEDQSFAVPDWQAADIEDALRLDGCMGFNVISFDEHFVYDTVHIWFEGAKRHYKEISDGSAITVELRPAGTLPDID